MLRSLAAIYRSPRTGAPLSLEVVGTGPEVLEGTLRDPEGETYCIEGGIPDLTFPRELPGRDRRARDFYDGRVEDYDRYLPLTFETFCEREDDVREQMVDRLGLRGDATVLEIGCGSGRDSVHIARRIPDGTLVCTDISKKMLAACRQRVAGCGIPVEIAVANASHLPFADGSFDAIFQFGGVGEFGDIGRFFREVVRVARPGARVVVGDESIPVWLRDTEFARILTFTNPQFAAPLPLEYLPVEARDVSLRWIIGGTFYLIDFTVGTGEPQANLSFTIPGVRGGTHRTRYYGQLEGVTPETKDLAHEARAKLGISMHDWLDSVVREAAARVLRGGSGD
jgi:ubiquinone/menaquinone biosynthesis C-methylase UbiE